MKLAATAAAAALLLSGCGLFDKPASTPSPKPPAAGQIEESAKGAGEAIDKANTATVAVTAAGATIAEKVDAAAKNVGAMAPPLARAEQKGGDAAEVAKEIKPLAKATADELDGAKKGVDDGRKALGDLRSSLAVATDRVKVLQGQVALVSEESQRLAGDLKKSEDARAELKKSIEDGKVAVENRWRNIVFGFAMLCGVGAMVALFALKDRALAATAGCVGGGTVVVYFVVRGMFKAEGVIGWIVAAALVAGFCGALWHLWRHHPSRTALTKPQA